MRPKARGLAHHGGPSGWLTESDPAGVILNVMTLLVAMTGAAQLRADGISSCCYIVNVHNHPSRATSRKEGMVWYSS
jgi:hypothetical protein